MSSGEIVHLLLQLALAVPGGGSDAAVHRRVRRRRPDEGGELGPSHVAQDVHFEEAVLGRGEARAELGVGPCRAEDVGDTELLVANDDRPRTERERLHPLGLAQVGEEARILVEGADVGGLQVGGDGEQVGVQRLLVPRVRGEALASLRSREVGQVVRPGLPRRNEVEDLAPAAVLERRADWPCFGQTGPGARRNDADRRRIRHQKAGRQQGDQPHPSHAVDHGEPSSHGRRRARRAPSLPGRRAGSRSRWFCTRCSAGTGASCRCTPNRTRAVAGLATRKVATKASARVHMLTLRNTARWPPVDPAVR